MGNIASAIGKTFDSNAVDPAAPADALPDGRYLVQITAADVAPLKSGNGMGLRVEYTVLEGEYAKRKCWSNLNIAHTNPQAEQIGQSQLSALCRAVGIGTLEDTAQLADVMLCIRTKIRKQEGYADKAEVVAWEPVNGNAAPAAAKPAAAAPAKPAPWQKPKAAA